MEIKGNTFIGGEIRVSKLSTKVQDNPSQSKHSDTRKSKEDHLLLLVRCTTKNYAQQMLEKGTLRFGKPSEWIKWEKKQGKGRGDIYEGSYAIMHSYSQDVVDSLLKQRPHSYFHQDKSKSFYYFQSDLVLDARAFCLYALNESALTLNAKRSQDHLYHYSGSIPKEYFMDFYPEMTREIYDSMTEEEKPVMVMIFQTELFYGKMIEALRKFGVRDDEIDVMPVQYHDFNEEDFIVQPLGKELFVKDKYYQRQSEFRVSINTVRKELVEKFDKINGIIEIGNLNGIAKIYDYYFDDMILEKRGNEVLFSLPKEEVGPITQEVLLAGLYQALSDELPKSPMTILEIEENIRMYCSALEKDYGMTLDRQDMAVIDSKSGKKIDFRGAAIVQVNHYVNYLNEGKGELAEETLRKIRHLFPNFSFSMVKKGEDKIA